MIYNIKHKEMETYMIILYSELICKDVIDCNSGSIIGNVVDIEISCEDFNIIAFIVQECSFPFRRSERIRISCDKIQKIGKDVIIVNFNYCKKPDSDKKNDKKKFNFKK